MDNIRTFLQSGLSLLSSLRWVPALLFLAALVTVTLVACGDGGGSSEQASNEGATAGTPESTAGVQIQTGQELTVEEYAEAMEQIVAAREERIEAAGEALFSGDLFSGDELGRISSLEANVSWTEEDVEFASDFAETMLQAITGIYGDLLRITRDSLDEISSLKPPEHLTDLHGDYVATSREVLPLVQDFLEGLQDLDTDIGNGDELADFMAALDSGPTDAEDPEVRAEGACRELEGQLEAELERAVSICDPDVSGATSAAPAVEPAPTAAPAASEPAADETSAETDREALVALYHATDGPNWTNNDNWLSDRPLDEWYGISTNFSGRVTNVRLDSNQLSGEIPAALGQLFNGLGLSLGELDLSDNELRGQIPPELSQLSELGSLYLMDNQLSGEIPAELGQLPYLEWLNLSGNELTGQIPAELGQRSATLRGLLLKDNRLSGEIPVELGQLSKLISLDLGGNQLSGEIPMWLGGLVNLEGLDLSINELTGEIPAEVGQLSNLRVLRLSGNDLSGCVPDALRDVRSNDFDELGLPFC